AIGHVELRVIAARVEPVCANTGFDETDLRKRAPIDQIHSAGLQLGYEERCAVRRDPGVLWHSSLREPQIADDFAAPQVDLDQAARVLARKDDVTAVAREIRVIDAGAPWCGDRILQLHRLWIAEVQALQSLRDHDGRTAVRGEVHV